jgi:hypothetical protein
MEATEASHEEMEATVNTRQEQLKATVSAIQKMEAMINSIWSEMKSGGHPGISQPTDTGPPQKNLKRRQQIQDLRKRT